MCIPCFSSNFHPWKFASIDNSYQKQWSQCCLSVGDFLFASLLLSLLIGIFLCGRAFLSHLFSCLFKSGWICGYLLYVVGYDSLLSLFLLLHRFGQVTLQIHKFTKIHAQVCPVSRSTVFLTCDSAPLLTGTIPIQPSPTAALD